MSWETLPASYEAEHAHWRSAIEDTDQDRHTSAADRLLVALRNTLQRLLDDGSKSTIVKVQGLLDDDYVIFRRLAIHLVTYKPALFVDALEDLLSVAASYHDLPIHHEFLLLLATAFPLLNTAHQDQVTKIIRSGYDEVHRK